MSINRRLFVTSALALIAAPAIVRASSLMPVKAILASEPVLTGGGDNIWGWWIQNQSFEPLCATFQDGQKVLLEPGEFMNSLVLNAPRPQCEYGMTEGEIYGPRFFSEPPAGGR